VTCKKKYIWKYHTRVYHFISKETEGKVCKLKKSLYGLKQSPRPGLGGFAKRFVL
jgi:hypothetical protein